MSHAGEDVRYEVGWMSLGPRGKIYVEVKYLGIINVKGIIHSPRACEK